MRYLVLLLAACSVVGPTPQEMLDRSVFTYNQHLRWKRFDKAASFIDKPARAGFIKTFDGSDDILNIDDIELKGIEYETESLAKVTVETRYYKLPSVTLQKTKWVQIWKRDKDEWWLSDHVRGPFFPEPASQPASHPVPPGR